MFLSLPMMLNQLISMTGQFLCTYMLITFGPRVVATYALIFSLQVPIIQTAIACLSIMSVLISNRYHAKDLDQCCNYLQHSWILSLLLSSIIFIFLSFCGPIFVSLGYDKTVAANIQHYFSYYRYGVFFILLSACNTQFGNSTERQYSIFTIGILSTVVLIIVAYLCVLKLHMQVSGIAVAIGIQGFFYFIATTISFIKFKLLFRQINIQLKLFFEIAQFGLPITLQVGCELFGFFLLTQIVALLGISALASYQLINQYLMLAIIPIMAFSQACAILIAKSVNNNDSDAHHIGTTSLILITIIVIAFAGASFEMMADILSSNITNHFQTLENTIIMLYAILFLCLDAVKNVLLGLLRGFLDTRFPVLVTLSAIFIINLPLSYFFSIECQMGLKGLFIAISMGTFINNILLYLRFEHVIHHTASKERLVIAKSAP